jgi:branched-subunit amino acid ABC-type transport system permease component
MIQQIAEALISGIPSSSVLSSSPWFSPPLRVGLVYCQAFFTWGAYFAWVLAVGVLKLPYVLVFLVAIPLMAALGIGIERFIVRPLRHRPAFDWNILLATLGIALVLATLALVLFGARTKSLPSLLEGTMNVGRFVISLQQFTMFALSILLALGLTFLLNKTRVGMAMRAVAQDSTGARIVGIPVNAIYRYTFGFPAGGPRAPAFTYALYDFIQGVIIVSGGGEAYN